MLALIMVVGVGAIAARAGYLGLVERGDLTAIANDQRIRTVPLPAVRGTIYDRSLVELAAHRPTARVEATPYLVTRPDETAFKLAPLLGREKDEIADKLRGNGTWVMLSREVNHTTARRIRALNLTGIDLIETSGRAQPQGAAAPQVVGFVNDEGTGVGGLEKALDTELRGTAGERVEARDPRQETLKVLRSKEPRQGENVVTTIDVVLQRRVQQILAETVSTHNARSATAVVMRPDTGEILTMVTAPSYNPNNRSTYTDERAQNRAVAAVFEPGSTFKVVTFAGAIESRKVTPSTTMFVPQWRWIDQDLDRKLFDHDKNRPAQTMSVAQILMQSSNVGTTMIAERLGPARINHWIDRFGFGKTTGSGLPGEERGQILPTNKWSGASILNIPIGQGDSVTQLQLTRAYAAIANKGVMPTPRLVNRVGTKDVPPSKTTRVMSPSTAASVTDMLRGVVSADGTGSEAEIPGYEVAGKTGTANKIDPQTGEYSSTYVASFVGFLPANDPKIVVSVVVDEPRAGLYTGGTVAAPAFEKIGQFCLNRLRIPPD